MIGWEREELCKLSFEKKITKIVSSMHGTTKVTEVAKRDSIEKMFTSKAKQDGCRCTTA